MIKNDLEKYQVKYQENAVLKEYTTLHIGGEADYIVFPNSISQIQICVTLFKKYQIPYTVLGKGSNVLVLDEGYRGGIILLDDNFSDIEMMDKTHVKVQAGMTLKGLCQFCLTHQLTGLEFACGIPGSVGGAVYMNAGAYGGEMKDVVESVIFLDEQNAIKCLSGEQLCFHYRQSYFSQNQSIILEVIYRLEIGNFQHIEKKMTELMNLRYQKQPMENYSAGSTFKRPKGHYASALIKYCQLQGFSIGDAEVSKKHAGFLINKANATSKDFLTLMHYVQKEVYEQTGYLLESEVQILNHQEKTL